MRASRPQGTDKDGLWTCGQLNGTCPHVHKPCYDYSRGAVLGRFSSQGHVAPGMIGRWFGGALGFPRKRWLLNFERPFLSWRLLVRGWCELSDPHCLVGIGLEAGQRLVLVMNADVSVQMLAQLHTGPSIAALVWSGRKLQFVSSEGYRVVIGYGALMAEAKARFESVESRLLSIG